jgi:3-methylcrotonyl-CoA carboxylase alpha subunit
VFRRVLIANRGEIARRIIRTCHRLGIEAVAVYSDADEGAPFVREADTRARLGPPPVRESYLDVGAILAAARATGADAVHPGYGFLSEKAAFAEAVQGAGLAWVGPPPSALRAVGDKIAARRLMAEAGVPVLPGSDGPVDPGAAAGTLAALAERVGYPVLVKAAGGGGGIGVDMVAAPDRLAAALRRCADRGRSAFGDGRVFLERFLEKPRHVEVQVLAAPGGPVLALGERECSLQRRYQKVVEEAPSPGVARCADPGAVRAALGDAAVRAARACGYSNAGTVEFLLAGGGAFYFLEVNARLQVEHPVTEATRGLDLVEEQLRIAAGEAPSEAARAAAAPAPARGAAIECRICAEDPRKRFAPAPGTVGAYREPAGEGVRVDSALEAGAAVTPYYDSLVAKVVTHGATRDEAIARMARALDDLVIEGLTTNTALCRAVMADADFRAGAVHTGWLEPFARRWAES